MYSFAGLRSPNLRRTPLLFLLATFAVCAQSPKTRMHSPADRAPRSVRIDVVESSEDLHESLQDKPPLHFRSSHAEGLTIVVSDAAQYQQIDGFGASLTDSSAWLISQKLTAQQRHELLQMLFDPKKGIGLSMLRQPMGASDFALKGYSYDDLPPGQTDPDMKHFSIDHDREQIIPILRQVLALNSNLKIIASPWSPPGWMKTSGSMIQGTLLPSAYAPLAKYFVRYVQAYETSGVPIFAVTPQNEPLNIPGDYPGMGMSSDEQTKFIRDNLGPAFLAAGIKAKILTFDHNWDLINFPVNVLSDKQAAPFIAGIAIHCYGGSPTAQTELHNRFPDKDIWLTECSGGEWQKGRLLEEQVRLIISTTRNWAKGVILWNLALNQNHEPFLGGCKTCRAVVTIDDSVSPSRIIPTVDFTALGHASKFVAPGAFRIDSSTFEQDRLESVAFRNPDGSIVLIVLNGATTAATFNLGWKEKYASYQLEPAAVATFRWPSQTAKPLKSAKPAFTMTISTDHETVAPGSKVIVTAHLTNVSDRELRFGWFGFGGPDLAYRVEIRNIRGQLAPYTEDYGKRLRREPPYEHVIGRSVPYFVDKGETVTEEIEVTKQYDLSAPGKYTIRVFHPDREADVDVQSTNTITLTVTE